ncbi:FGGY-family carbohydrate kinase [Ruania rhizosphaerae]|uniref:FGGY-family carbohydrate kinase n=1 Tax=Ruania rhizosphaerae TaxID=1840413 RepID=UPI00135C5702|nr:FGGY family carbohydrate kinase [Ruania rhizosphaerae]
MRGELLLGVDVGSTSIKVQAVDAGGVRRSLVSAPTPWTGPAGARHAEADALLGIVLRQMRMAKDQAGGGRIAGIGLTGFAESGVMIDAAGTALTPVLPWYDLNGDDIIADLAGGIGHRTFSGVTGLAVNHKPSIMKFRWFARNCAEPRRWARWLSVEEWIAYALTGEQATEMSLASRTGLFDVLKATEAEDVLDSLDLPRGLLAPLVHAGERVGTVTGAHPSLDRAAVTIAGMDHLAASVGLGATGAGDMIDSCGTGESIIRRLGAGNLTREQVADAVDAEIAIGRDVLPDSLQGMCSLRSGIGLWRFMKLLGLGESDLDHLDEEAFDLVLGPDDPHVDEIWLERATLTNIGYEPRPAMVWRAAVECIGRRAAELADRLDALAGPRTQLVLTGGGLRTRTMRKVRADHMGPYHIPEVDEATSRGAAELAAVAAGLRPAFELNPRPSPGAAPGAEVGVEAGTESDDAVFSAPH